MIINHLRKSELKVYKLCRRIKDTKNKEHHCKDVINAPTNPNRFGGNYITDASITLNIVNYLHKNYQGYGSKEFSGPIV